MDHSELLKTVHYNPDTGEFTRLTSAGNAKAGTSLGNPSKKGYIKALVMGEYVKIHRLAWFYVTGEWPTEQLDHINRIKADNRFCNLRLCSTSSNCINQIGPRSNNSLGLQGVVRIPKTGRFRSGCTVNGIKHHLGVFATAAQAHEVYLAFKNPLLPLSNP